MRKFVFVGAALASLWAASPTRAGVLLTDTFSYPDGSLTSVSGGTWVHHSGTNFGELQVVSGQAFLSQTNSEDVNAPLLGQPYFATNSTVLYASFTVNFRSLPSGASGGYFAHFKDPGTTIFRDKIYATTNGAVAGAFRIGLANVDNTPNVILGTDLNLNTDYLLVTRYVLSNASSTIWLNPASEADAGVTAGDVSSGINVTSFALRESLSSGNGMGSLFFDNLVVGTNFVDVVPNVPPGITTQPTNQTVTAGLDATFNVAASGSPPLTYQWQFYGTNLPAQTNASLFLAAVTTDDAGPYTVAITNAYGGTNSQTATLTVNPAAAPVITSEPQSQTVVQGSTVIFSVTATGDPLPAYQWKFNNADVPGATDSMLTLLSVTTNQAGVYSVSVTNFAGSTNSDPATLAVTALPQLSYLTYNLEGFGATNWTTNSPQIQAIGREVMYLNPDILGFNEIPNAYYYEMTNFVKAFLPGYYLQVSPSSDGALRNGVASRFPIVGFNTYLHNSDLSIYGYTNTGNFTRDLFEARIAVPNFPQLLHVFVVHLKSGQGTDDSLRRGAEADAISNFFYTVFLPTNTSFHPYLLSGDMNEDIARPPSSHPMSMETLTSAATGLKLTTPVNPFTGSELTHSIQPPTPLDKRYDYILPSGLLFSNILSSQVFRTDLLTNPPPPLMTNDDITASDHLPVLMVFNNPYSKPFRLLSIQRNDPATILQWQAIAGQTYHVEASSNLLSWQIFATNLLATGATYTVSVNVTNPLQFFRVAKGP